MRNIELIDQINIETAYIKSVLDMLALHFEEKDGARLNDVSYANIVYMINSHVENIEKIVNQPE
nr:hypothetical protein [uncultured Haemophilus sp.]